MSNSEVRIGVTPILQRLAYSFLCKGFGMHGIEHPLYDAVVVRELYHWKQNPMEHGEYGGGIVVEFLNNGERRQFVEFGVRRVGAGGQETIRLLEADQEEES